MPLHDDTSSSSGGSSSSSSSNSSSSNSVRTGRATGHWIFFSRPPPLPPQPEERIRQYEELMDIIHKRLLMRQSVIRNARRADQIRWLENNSRIDRGLYFFFLHRVEALEEEYRESQRSLLERLQVMAPAQLQARLEEARDMSPRWWPAKAWLPNQDDSDDSDDSDD